jgi:FMN-dependent NADH-azoreductase
MRLLHIDSSILGEKAVSRSLTGQLVSRWRAADLDLEVTYLDRGAEPLRHLGTCAARRPDGDAAAAPEAAFVGITDPTFVRAEGLAISPESRQRGLDAALASIPAPRALAA